MRRSLLLLVTAACLAAGQQIVQFKDHVIEANAKGGYAVIVTDINKDGKPDVIGISQQMPDLNWYENPTWQPHLMVKDMLGQVNLAAYDVDGDGITDIITGAGRGGGPHVVAFSGRDGSTVRSFFPYDASFLGGVFVG